MKYEKPNMEILLLDVTDIVTLSSESSGDGDNYTGGWSSQEGRSGYENEKNNIGSYFVCNYLCGKYLL